MPNMKNEMNHNLLTQTIDKINHMDYYDQMVKFIATVIGNLRKTQRKKVQDFHKGIFCIKNYICLDDTGVMR